VITRAQTNPKYWVQKAQLGYGLTTEEIRLAVEAIYDFLHAINGALDQHDLGLFENLALGNTFSGLISEVLVKSIAKHSKTLVRNRYVGGHPDLLPSKHPKGDNQLRCDQGIEVKTSKQSGGWQAHNPEAGWLMVFRYELATSASKPTRFVQILSAELALEDWSLAERGKASRRTRTCSINQRGVEKLRSNPVYQEPDCLVRSPKQKRQLGMDLKTE